MRELSKKIVDTPSSRQKQTWRFSKYDNDITENFTKETVTAFANVYGYFLLFLIK